jgi:hypothetical protein
MLAVRLADCQVSGATVAVCQCVWQSRLLPHDGGSAMIRRMLLAAVAVVMLASLVQAAGAQERAYSRNWGGQYGRTDWERFYHYPYVWYPQNFWGNEYYRSSDDLYNRYPPEMRVPVYNKQWQNFYPEARRYHQGHQFILDVF